VAFSKLFEITFAAIEYKGGSTHTAAAVQLAIQQMNAHKRSDALSVVALLNDGYSQDLWPNVLITTQLLDETTKYRYVAALADQIYMPELVLYSGDPERVYRTGDTTRYWQLLMTMTKSFT
jgi:hypothetical protein